MPQDAPSESGGARRWLITGAAGFIGFHLARRLLAEGHRVTGIDGMTDYYDIRLKRRRHEMLLQTEGYDGHEVRLEDADAVMEITRRAAPDVIVHLAAQAGVRYSLEAPRTYIETNLTGTFNVMEAARALRAAGDGDGEGEGRRAHLMMASTSSVYGANAKMPFAETDPVDHPMTIYAATKRANEAMAHSYAHLWDVPTTMFRFFTVYGSWGRPDMALFKFVKAILEGRAIDIYNHGEMRRDFTHVSGLVEGIVRLADAVPPAPDARDAVDPVPGDSLSPVAPWRVVNVGGGQPEKLLDFVDEIERALGRPAIRNMMDMQLGDVPATWADASLLEALTGFRPLVPLSEGVPEFVRWYRDYYDVPPR